jgi:hypothetical protein
MFASAPQPTYRLSSANGGGGQFVHNQRLAGVADVGAVHSRNIGGVGLDTTIANLPFGPRLSIKAGTSLLIYFRCCGAKV